MGYLKTCLVFVVAALILCTKVDATEEDDDAKETAATTKGVRDWVVGTATPFLIAKAGTLGLNALGFTTSGIGAGTVAATVQSTLGSVAAGSWFATLQSVGATGGFALASGPFGWATAAAGGGYVLYNYLSA